MNISNIVWKRNQCTHNESKSYFDSSNLNSLFFLIHDIVKKWWQGRQGTGRDVSRGSTESRFRSRFNRRLLFFPGREYAYYALDKILQRGWKAPFCGHNAWHEQQCWKARAVNEPLELKSTHMASQEPHVAWWIRYEAVQPPLILVLGNLTRLRPPRLKSNAIAWFISVFVQTFSYARVKIKNNRKSRNCFPSQFCEILSFSLKLETRNLWNKLLFWFENLEN